MKRQARKKSLTKRLTTSTDTKRLEKETRKLVNKANARLDSLQRRYKSGTWATKNLANRLSSGKVKMWTRKGKIKLGKKPSKQQLIAVNKAISQFLNSQTSTKKGIADVKRKQIAAIKRRRNIEDEDFTEQDAEDFYEMFGEDTFRYFADKIGDSLLQQIIYDAIREKDSEDDFIDRLSQYIEINDLDIREKAIRLYEKYVL